MKYMRERAKNYCLSLLALLLSQVLLQADPQLVETVVIDGTLMGVGGTIEQHQLRRIVAYKKGNVFLPHHDRSGHYNFTIKKIISGTISHDGFPNRPQGIKYINNKNK